TSNGGHIYHNGVLWPDGQLTPDQGINTLSQWTYVAGPRSEERRVGIECSAQGGAYNSKETAKVSTQAAANQTPTSNGTGQSDVTAGTSIALSRRSSQSATCGSAWSSSVCSRQQTSNGGHIYHNGVLWPDGQLTPDQGINTLSQWTYVAGP